jgi:hypothetical protein
LHDAEERHPRVKLVDPRERGARTEPELELVSVYNLVPMRSVRREGDLERHASANPVEMAKALDRRRHRSRRRQSWIKCRGLITNRLHELSGAAGLCHLDGSLRNGVRRRTLDEPPTTV